MKNFLIISLLLMSTVSSSSQPYSFAQSKGQYLSLENATNITNGKAWSGFEAFTIPIGFPFLFMDSVFTKLSVESTGRLIFDENHYYYADMFVVAGMQDKGTSSSLSALSYQLSGTSGDQILKIEFKNATYKKDLGSTISYQLWLYEKAGTIELHMGPNHISNPQAAFFRGPYAGVFKVISFSPTDFDYGKAIIGNPLSPADTTFVGTGINDMILTLDNVPPTNTIYRFTPQSP